MYQSMLLRSQLNPHFIFNALNSVQYFILHEKVEEGLEFISDFSNLIRTVLRNSGKTGISIAEEVKFLQNYLKVEKHRMKNNLDFSITINNSIDSENQLVPPMLIQPYIENAIVHGFSNKSTKGNLSLTIENLSEQLICTIEDDGVGRAFTSNPKFTNPNQKSRSMSMALNANRLLLLEKQFGKVFLVEIEDKINEVGDSVGTIVKIFMPILRKAENEDSD